jgi:multidrug efflux pump subunit AcrB
MTLPGLAVRNRRFTLVIVGLLLALGLLSFLTMPRTEDPVFDIAQAGVVAVFPGADAEVVETLVVEPLEEAIWEIEELRTLETSVENGVATIGAEMVPGTDPDDAYDAVLQEVNDVLPDLPDEVEEVEVVKPQLGDVSILQLALVASRAPTGASPHEPSAILPLVPWAERLESRLERVAGVQRVDTWGYPDREVRIGLDPERMRALSVSVDQVAAAVRGGEDEIPGGFVTSGGRRLNVRTSGDFESLEAMGRALLPGTGDRLVRVEDVARVTWGTEDVEHRARLDGRPAVFVSVIQRDGTNIGDVMDRIRPVVQEVEGALPPGVEIRTAFDQSESVEARIGGFFDSLLQGIVLVGLIMLLFLGFRPALLVMITIPAAILFALGGVDLTGYGLQQMSIVGLVIALGLLVDDAIVVVENIGRLMREGLAPLEAALEGAAEVAWPSASGTLTTVLAFLPMVAIPSNTGAYVRSLPVTVVYALVASLLLSLTLTPLVASRVLAWRRREDNGEGSAGAEEAAPPEPSGDAPDPAGAGVSRERPRNRGTGWLQARLEEAGRGPYRRTLAWSLEHPWSVLALGTVTLGLALALIPLVGVSLFPKAEKPQFLVEVEAPDGTSLETTDGVVRWIEDHLASTEEVVRYASNVGADNPKVYYNVQRRQPRPHLGQILVELTSYDAAATVLPRLQETFDRYPGARIRLIEFENGPPVEAPVVFRVTGPELGILKELAAEVETALRSRSDTRNVRNPLGVQTSDLRVAVDRDRLGYLGLDPVTVDLTVRASLAGVEVGRYRENGTDDVDIVARFPFTGATPTATPEDLERVTLLSGAGRAVPLAQVAELELTPGTGRIDHYDTERVATVTAYPVGEASPLDITNAVGQALEAREWPDGYRWFAGGTFEEQQEGFQGMLRALMVALLGIFAVLVLQFRSFLQPAIIFAAVPLAFVGSVGALLLTGYTFSFTAFIGITSLVGIVINNSILLVEYANRGLAQGRSVEEAVRRAGEIRFQPILLTTLTTVCGLLPLALTGSSLWSPLGWTIIGGLITSTALTLLVVPVLYRLLTGEREGLPA